MVKLNKQERWHSTDAFVAACNAAAKITEATGGMAATIDEMNTFQELLKQQGFSILPTEERELEEKVKWLEVDKNQQSVIVYKVSKEVANYIRATHTHVAPDFYLLPSGEWVRLIEQEPKGKEFMSNYHVKSGSFRVTIEARNHKMAVIKAIDENCPADLGVIISCLKEGDSQEEEIYMNTESVLDDMWFKEGYTENNIANQN